MNDAVWLPYALPLRQPWQSSRGTITLRRGRLRRLRTPAGATGWGDCAPLPEFGIDEALATDFAEECAQLDLAAQRAGQPLYAWLSGDPPAGSLAVNANLGPLLNAKAQDIAAACASGYRIVKLKAGTGPLAGEIEHLRHLAGALPSGCQLRLDANAAWTHDEARQFLSACRELPVEACEEPLRAPSAAALDRLQLSVPFAIAIDESLHKLGADVFRQPPVRRIVLKPSRQGSLLTSMEIGLRARAAGLEVIVSSALESSCGLLACAHLAAAIAPQATHGLATASWFSVDTGTPTAVDDGRLILPCLPGVGFDWAGATSPAFTLPASGEAGYLSECSS